TGSESVAAAYTVDDVEFCRRGGIGLAVHPGHGTPAVTVGGMHFAQGGGHNFHLRVFGDDVVDHAEEGAGIELRLGFDFRPLHAQTLLQVFFVAHDDID